VKVPSRRILGLISALAIVATACSASVTKVEVVSWWTTGDEATGFNAVIEQFSKGNPSIQVTNSAIADGAGAVSQSGLNVVLDQQIVADLKVVWPDVKAFAATLGMKL